MAVEPFQFKQFRVAHDRATHKVGTDAVLLGSWVNVLPEDTHILDIGTGSGIIALMLAQRTEGATSIDALEIHEQDAEQARENVARSPWPQKITVHQTAAQRFVTEKRYDLIVSNPPYFVKSLPAPDQKRTRARHTLDLSFEDLLTTVTRLITADGRFAVVLPYPEAKQFLELAESFGLCPLRTTSFRTRSHKPIERMLMEFSRRKNSVIKTELVLYYGQAEQWSAEYATLTGAFYIGRYPNVKFPAA